ncbi:MAG: class I SAM-dependent methyltransferase [Proteobacteria bacterium]|nr:class I SAM-dependent methyltransferase [Pseudomonadota bacterium]
MNIINKLRFLSLSILLIFSVFSIALSAQEHQGHSAQDSAQNDPNEHMNQASFEDLTAGFDSPDRQEWQKPEDAIAALGELTGKTVMDIGSGTGYFSFRLLDAGANVICADVDERFLNFIKEKRDNLGLADRMELRHVPYDSANLGEAEVDMVLIVDTYHHIEYRENYFAAVRQGIKPGGKLVVIDFEKRELPVGPPVRMKLDAETIISELRAAGFENFEVDHELLPYQYMIFAS